MDLSKLNNKQLEAVCHIDAPMLVIAGAGSGKTFTMITRIAYMIEHGINPENILAVTFTNKAAKEMRERAENIVGEKANYATISTFHSFCSKFLRIFHSFGVRVYQITTKITSDGIFSQLVGIGVSHSLP